MKRVKEKKVRHKRKKRAIFLVVEVLILSVLSVVAYGMMKMDKINVQDIQTNVTNKNLNLDDYTNVALFGLDARIGETDGVRSDTIIVASIDNKNKKINLISVFRDTFLQQKDGTYDKANSAYAYGGAQEAVDMLNKNLDLDIEDYASVNFKALADVVDLLGGIEIELTLEEIGHLNNYSVETSEVTGLSYTPLPAEAGNYNLSGVQAVSYARIRYTDGGDFKRAERQRIVLEKIMQGLKKAGILKLNKIIDKVLPEVTTSLDMKQMLQMAEYLIEYDMGSTTGFPFENQTPDYISGYSGSYVVPVNLQANVEELHATLFAGKEYEPSETLVQISNEIIYMTGIDKAYEDPAAAEPADTDSGYTDQGYEEPGYQEPVYEEPQYE